ncbi:MAG: hypothetical protein IJW67_09415 [Blautia sp.]|nr:hypothetical protein [Blautia sp.]
MAKWIWRFGEFECYHNMQVHGKRESYGYKEAPVWKIYAPEPAVSFRKEVCTDGGWMHIEACGDISVAYIENEIDRTHETRGAKMVYLEPGKHLLEVRVMNYDTFPALYIYGIVETDETWLADDLTFDFRPVGSWEVFDAPRKRPDVFPFSVESIGYQTKEKLGDGGVLYDYGKETFAGVRLTGLKAGEHFRIQYGESREEALDPEWSVVHFDRIAEDGTASFIPYAFRYLYISDENAQPEAEYEYLPLEKKGSFSCDDTLLNKIWDVAACTFHLNCREFFLDGIKRDRWVWSADAYQSLFVNRYLFFDKEIEQRTLIALGGKAPFRRHINTIVDYTFFWFMSLYEHYLTYGDLDFLRRMKPQMDEVMSFCVLRTSADGFVRGVPGDWIFIDWADMDKTGAVCAEQILYAKALSDYSKMCEALGEEHVSWAKKATELESAIFEKYWDESLGVFIDSFESGKQIITRQTNILAYLYLNCTEEQKKQVYENVVQNEQIAPITTPYFTFYENQVHCLAGNSDFLEASIRDYYGSMLETGATTLYEQYDPAQSGIEHYAMYGRKFEKSLCHAWSASPIYLLGRFRLGVKNTGIAYSTYEVKPDLGRLSTFEGTVPVPGGSIYVRADEKAVTVRSDIPGGTLCAEGKKIPIEPGKEFVL